MPDIEHDLWSGWPLIKSIDAAPGGAEARAHNRLQGKRRRQLKTLTMIAESRSDLLRGERDVDITSDQVAKWMEAISGEKEASVYETRDQVNLLVQGLERGRLKLGWKVDVPAPMHLIHRESSPFTPKTFEELAVFRDWNSDVTKQLISKNFSAQLNDEKTDLAFREQLSWGVVLFLSIEGDGLINARLINAIPLFCNTLTFSEDRAWMEFYGDTAKAFGSKPPPRSRWLFGPSSLAALLHHLSIYGQPKCKNYAEAKLFTKKSWRKFCLGVGSEHVSIETHAKRVELSLRLYLPPESPRVS